MTSNGGLPRERREPTARERAFYRDDVVVHAPSSVDELRDLVRFAESERRPVVPVGAGAHAGLADLPPPDALVVSTARFDAVVDYEPDDFTIGVQAGMTLENLRETLDAHGQELPVDLPQAAAGTAGGLVARAPFGPRTASRGTVSTLLLGVEGVRGEGKRFKSGGMVVKNVAGYPLAKFLPGSLGKAGFLLRVNFRLRSRPARRHLRLAGFASSRDAWELAFSLRAGGFEPAAIAVLSGSAIDDLLRLGFPVRPGDRVVAWLFEGIAARVDWLARESEAVARRVPGKLSPPYGDEESSRLLDWLASFPDPGPAPPPDAGVARIAVLPASLPGLEVRLGAAFRERDLPAAFWADAATGLLVTRWTAEPSRIAEPLEEVRAAAWAHGGTARLLYLPPDARRGWSHLLTGDPNAPLRRRVLDVFDPNGVFGRRPR